MLNLGGDYLFYLGERIQELDFAPKLHQCEARGAFK